MKKLDINQVIKELACEVFSDDNFTIDDFDWDRVWITRNNEEYTIRTWDITESEIDWTLFRMVDNGDGTGHGEEEKVGLFEINYSKVPEKAESNEKGNIQKVNNVIHLNTWSNNHMLCRSGDTLDRTSMKYMYGDNTLGLVGTPTVINNREFASVYVLREEMDEQRLALKTGFNEDGSEKSDEELYPWEDLLVCKEGIFSWDNASQNYVLIEKL